MPPDAWILVWALAVFGATALLYRILLALTRVDPTLLAVIFYVVLLTISQYAASKITVYLGFDVPAGTMTYVATVAMLDIIVMREGFGYARNVIIAGFASQLLITSVNLVVLGLPSAAAPNGVYSYVFGTSARVAVASPIAYLAAETVDAYTVYRVRGAVWKRVMYSDPVAMAVDTLVFAPLAFYGSVPAPVLERIIVGLLLAKWSLAPIVLGVVYANRRYLMRRAYAR